MDQLCCFAWILCRLRRIFWHCYGGILVARVEITMISRNWSDTKEEQRRECNGITLDRVVMISIGRTDQKRKDGVHFEDVVH